MRARVRFGSFLLLYCFLIVGISAGEDPVRLTWGVLRQLKRTDVIPADLARLNGQVIRMRGFMVPLAGDGIDVNEFLLVPEKGMCIHIPPPPPNQTVYVRMKGGEIIKHSWDAVRITGILRISTRTSQYGAAYYEVIATTVE